MDALVNSLWLAGVAAVGAGLLGSLAAYVTVRSQMRGRGLVDGLSILPNALPGMVIAVGLILAWNRSWWPFPVYNTPIVLLLAYICLLLPYPVRYVGAGLRQVGASLDAAARVSGAGMGRTMWKVLLPLIAPNLFVAMLLVFAIASRELVASIMLAPSGMPTVATYVFNQFSQGSPGKAWRLAFLPFSPRRRSWWRSARFIRRPSVKGRSRHRAGRGRARRRPPRPCGPWPRRRRPARLGARRHC